MSVSEREFLARLRDTVVSLPYDLKLFFELMTDQDQSEEVRNQAAGVVIYVLGQADLIPDHMMPVGYVDDALILWLALEHFQSKHGDVIEAYRERFPEQLESVTETNTLFRGYLGELYEWLATKIEGLTKMVYKGKVAADYVQDEDAEEFLYSEAQAFSTDYEMEDDYLEQHLVRGSQVTDILAKRRAEEALRTK